MFLKPLLECFRRFQLRSIHTEDVIMLCELANATPEQVISCHERRQKERQRLLLELAIVEDELSRLEEILKENQ